MPCHLPSLFRMPCHLPLPFPHALSIPVTAPLPACQVIRGELDLSSDPWPKISQSAKAGPTHPPAPDPALCTAAPLPPLPLHPPTC
jgi:hypothetical protein